MTEQSEANEVNDNEFVIEQGLRDIYYNPKTGYHLWKDYIKKQKLMD